jgi:hypothetical protein
VLLFLGFTGDDFFADAFTDAEAFASRIRTRLADLVPPDVIGRRVPHRSGGSMSILVGTLPVGTPSGRL